MEDRDEELVLNTHRNAVGKGTRNTRPANYQQMRVMMRRIVQDMKADGITDPTNAQIEKEYSRRMLQAREQV